MKWKWTDDSQSGLKAMNLIVALLIMGAFLGIIAFIFAILSIVFGTRLGLYIKKNDYEKWCRLTSIHTRFGDLEAGIHNPWKAWRYLNSEEDKDDKFIRKFKALTRKTANSFFLCFLGSLLVFAMAILVIFLK